MTFCKKYIIILFCLPFLIKAQTQITENWSTRYSGNGDYSDRFNCMTTDISGNIFLGGYSVRIGNNRDFLTVKMNSIGDTLWMRTFNGPGNGPDEVEAIAVDGSGNVFVTGFQKGNGTGNDYLTIKYSTTGDTLWTRVYNYSANNDDLASSVAVDGNGNVFVTGQSSNGTDDDYATVKYNASGTQQWAIRFNGLGGGTDRAVKVVTDNGGNSFVTGRSDNGSDDDFVTVKYNSSGVQQWVVTFDGGYGNDRPVAMTIDASYNFYIAGRSNNGTNYDFAVVKYNSLGTEQWFSTYDNIDDDRATAIAVDASGNVYVTGQSDIDASAITNYDFMTIKYDASGNEVWASPVFYNGSGNGDDIPYGIVVDNSGNSYITGESDADPSSTSVNKDYATIKYNSSGVEQWTQTYSGSGNTNDTPSSITKDNSGNIIVSGGSQIAGNQKDGAVIKYNTSGIQQWLKTFAGEGDNSDNVNAMATDASGNIYLAGYTVDIDSDRDMCVMKLNSSGDTLWVRKYNGTSNFTDEATDIAVDGTGNIFITGYSKNSGVSYDYTTIKYNPNGDTLWVRKYNSPYNGSDKAASIDIDASSNSYVTGYSKDASDLDDIATVKYNASGVQQWVARYNGTGNADDKGISVLEGASGNVYVTGSSNDGTDDNIVTLMYNASGAQQWIQTYNGGNGNDRPVAMTIDYLENIYVAGSSKNLGLDDDFVTIKYNSSGSQQWAQRYNGSLSNDDLPSDIAVDAGCNVYVTGNSVVDTTGGIKNYDFLTLKYNSSGVQLWAKNYNGQANADDMATAIALDNSGDIYVTGESEDGTSVSPNKNFTTLEYDPTGNLLWYAIYNGSSNGTDSPNSIAFNNGKLIVAGGSWGLNSQKDILVLEYSTMVGIHEATPFSSGIEIYPNPSNDYIYIDGIPNNSEIRITDFDGKVIQSWVSENNITNGFDIKGFHSGIYFININNIIFEKIVVVN